MTNITKPPFSLILIALFSLIAVIAFAKDQSIDMEWPDGMMKDFEKKVHVKALGDLHLVYHLTGEPVSAPATFEILVKCSGKANEGLIEKIPMCHLTQLKLDQVTKTISASFMLGRVDEAGRAKCDVKDEREIPLLRVCTKKKNRLSGA